LHEEDDNDGSGEDIDSIAIDNTNGVKMKDDDLETGCSGDGVAMVEESLSLLLSVVADDIDDNNKKQNNKNKDIKEDINLGCDCDDIMDKKDDNNNNINDNNKKNDTKKDKKSSSSEDSNNNMMIDSGQNKTNDNDSSSTIDYDNPTTTTEHKDGDTISPSSLLPTSLFPSSGIINTTGRTPATTTTTSSSSSSSTILRYKRKSEVGAFAIDSPFASDTTTTTTTISIASMMTNTDGAATTSDDTDTDTDTDTNSNSNTNNSNRNNTQAGSSFGTTTNDNDNDNDNDNGNDYTTVMTTMTDGLYNASVTLVQSSTTGTSTINTDIDTIYGGSSHHHIAGKFKFQSKSIPFYKKELSKKSKLNSFSDVGSIDGCICDVM